jgi:membrane-associated protease RseP (regulator of RpoE activity)
MLPIENDPLEQYTALVGRVLKIEDITRGDAKKQFVVRYRGRLYSEDSAAAYDQLAAALKPLDITPLFRDEQGKHVVILMAGVVRPKPSNPWVNLAVFALTVVSVFFVGVSNEHPDVTIFNFWQYAFRDSGNAWGYTISLLAILLAHEFGHYLMGRLHGTAVSLPYFIPMPTILGTMGAFIQMKDIPKNRRVLLDIGIAGPLAGLVVTVPILLFGLSLSQINQIPEHFAPGMGVIMEGNSLFYLASKFLVFGKLLPEPASYGSLGAFFYWVRYFFTGQPSPLGAIDVTLHPIAWAGWAGLMVTGFNLIPAGQLDGGHLLYVLLGRRMNNLLPFVIGGLVLLGIFSPTWWLLTVLILLFGRFHAEPLDQITPLDPGRRILAILGLVIFVLVFTPVPLLILGG